MKHMAQTAPNKKLDEVIGDKLIEVCFEGERDRVVEFSELSLAQFSGQSAEKFSTIFSGTFCLLPRNSPRQIQWSIARGGETEPFKN